MVKPPRPGSSFGLKSLARRATTGSGIASFATAVVVLGGCVAAEEPTSASKAPPPAAPPAAASPPASAPIPASRPGPAPAPAEAPTPKSRVQISPAAYDFGDVRLGEPVQGWISVASLGPGAIQLESMDFVSGDRDVFEISPAFEGPLQPDERSGIIILYLPCAPEAPKGACRPRRDTAELQLKFAGAEDPPPIRLTARVVDDPRDVGK